MVVSASVSFYPTAIDRDVSPAIFRRKVCVAASLTRRRADASKEQQTSSTSSVSGIGKLGNNSSEVHARKGLLDSTKRVPAELMEQSRSLKDYFEESERLIKSADGGPPRWFSPLECRFHSKNSPLLLYLPGIDGVGFGLAQHHRKLGEIFDLWCLHIPVTDQTPFSELVKMIEDTVRSENHYAPKRPVYLVGESLGGCLAFAVAARNPEIDLVLILANPATCFSESWIQPLLPLLEVIPGKALLSSPYVLSLMTDIPSRMMRANMGKGLTPDKTVEEILQNVTALSSYLSVLAEVMTVETLISKLKMLQSASSYANSRLHAVKAQILLLSSGKDLLLPSKKEGERLLKLLPSCEIRRFNESGHTLFLDDDVDLVTIIKSLYFYRCSKKLDYALDYLPPSPSEFNRIYEPYRWLETATSPVMLTTLDSGKIVRGLSGIPSEGPVLFVGYHMFLGLEIYPLVSRFLTERNIVLRGMSHPLMFSKSREGSLPESSSYDAFRCMGAVPVSATNFFKLFSSKSHVLLYPGGMREALHRKGEEYKLFWPEKSEFVRMAARFGAKIIPFGSVGEDDVTQMLLDYNDLIKIPYFKSRIEDLTKETAQLRTDTEEEVTKQQVHLPVFLPKLPGRFYYLFGNPIETEGRQQELKNREKANELYLEVKSEVEQCIDYLRKKRESDPYRNILPRLVYQSMHGFESEVPTFEL